VLDDGPMGGGETGRTTAHLATSFDDYYHEAARVHGESAARLLAESFRAGVDAIERIVREEGIDCDFRRLDGWWFPASPEDRALLERERDAAHRLGFADVTLVESGWPLAGLPAMPAGPALRWPGQGQFHIHRYIAGLAAAAERRGARVFTGAHVSAVEEHRDAPGGAAGRRCAVTTDAGRTVRADDVVQATNAPILDRFAMHTKQAPYRTYVIGARVRRSAVPAGLYWDTLDPYHYVRLLDGGTDDDAGAEAGADDAWDVLIVGGEDHKTGQSDDENASFDRLEAWTRARFPVEAVEHRWSGQVLEPVDLVAFIGRDPEYRHVWLVTGDSGNGMTHGTIAGLLIPSLIAGEEHPWAALYHPGRVTLSLESAKEWVKENLNVAVQYADYVDPTAAVDDVAQVPPGEGRIVRRGAQPLAVYRGEDGALTVRSAICPHLYCVVDWNAAERSWDCPCHGSRFAPDGTVLNGPSRAPLAEAELPPAQGSPPAA
jgi:glycine/D-amino acid oxidase-like deaminating enzyme/nitrite reductase/ring-hydroxylating ferredoxin subunit